MSSVGALERAEGIPDDDGRGTALLRRVLAGTPQGEAPLTHAEVVPAREGRRAPWPEWVPDDVRARLAARGIPGPWRHQAEAAEHAWAGRHVVVSTGTASGKSLAYQLPVVAGLSADPRATALYLSPTKALGADQLRAARALDPGGEAGLRASSYDGDTPYAERDAIRRTARWIFTNPDMLHRGVLPRHGRWTTFLRRLRYVVIDEAHAYRGVFGSHVALLLRRLRRVCARYGAHPVFVLASATMSDPATSASALTGLDVVGVTDDASPRGARAVGLWEPPLLEEITGENGAPVRRSAGAETSRILADLVVEGARSLAFVRSRRGAELAALGARRVLAEVDPDLADRVAAYRAGFLPEERRALEESLLSGELRGVATTNALELGIDIAGLDAVVVAGFPGTRASFWQQAGRAGRSGDDALVLLVARDDPLDTFLVHHPAALLGAPLERCVLDPTNPYVLAPHLACAASEMPLTAADVADVFPGSGDVLADLVAEGLLRHRRGGWFWALPTETPHHGVDIRGSGGEQVVIVESDTGRMLGTVDPGAAHSTVHEGAVHLHQGASYVVDELDLEENIAHVHAEEPEWTTQSRSVTDIAVVHTEQCESYGAACEDGPELQVCLGTVEVTEQVVGYLRRMPSGQIVEQVPLDLPERTLATRAVWYTLSESLLAAIGVQPAAVPGSLHAAEHAAIGLMPLVATCDRWDIGGVSTALHPDTGRPTVFVHDGHPGGAGFADRGHEAMRVWLTATRDAIADCECRSGCPSCVQSPKCGNGNDPLDKAGAIAVLTAVLDRLG
ncbi:DEAD/DEAH box helicase [Actinomycetospora sp. NBRC 106378]|uniref:DEAD/DEAH box helicase n=1 Tax=Actinomycetospora sp. NBRC 106378 TaxID=3032208 RepID=UPI00249FEE2C|nr:DEAD/DEAH box helicase [Actinomycetospora sp. NBRC 106378]GLZ52918.1 ATP-dependent RNA helicase, DEAD/DEAH box family protein [Actinomycetospora sp. NBRC 106378]